MAEVSLLTSIKDLKHPVFLVTFIVTLKLINQISVTKNSYPKKVCNGQNNNPSDKYRSKTSKI